jgi:hypothetical protein
MIMKKIFILIILAGSLFLNNIQAQEYYQGSVKVELTATGPQLVFLMKLTSSNATKNSGFTGIEYYITYSNTYTLTFGAPVNNTVNFPTLSMIYGGQNVNGVIPGKINEWWYFTGLPTTAQNYNVGQEYEVFRVAISTASQDFGDLSLEYDGSTYYTYLVFTDAIGTGWTTADQYLDVPLFYGPGTYSGANGAGVLDGGACAYSIFDKPLVPMVLWQNTVWAGGTGPSNSPGNADGSKKCYVRDLIGPITATNANVGQLIIQPGASLDFQPNSGLTASGATTISDAGALKVLATVAGIGSFIDNGTITYGALGSASVETFLANAGAVGTFYMHQIGPTVVQTPPGGGINLGALDLVTLGTYAYFYQESNNTWVNVYDPNTLVPTTKGLILSTDDQTNHTITLTGQLVTGAVISLPLGFSGNNIDLISNPYPSSIDFDLFYGNNIGTIGSTYYIWDPTIGSYKSYTNGVGGSLTDAIVPGQGFFVTTTAAAPVIFNNGQRVHATGPLVKDMTPYMLTLEAAGNTFKEYTHIHFMEDATYNYDVLYDAHKWASVFDNATEISTLSADLQALCMNSNPMLGNGLHSVPMTFTCGAEGTYTIAASGIETFDAGTEIYLEDLLAGGEWYNLVANQVYEFTATPSDDPNRFIVHFFGPAGINDLSSSPIRIYGWQQDAYIINRGNETIKECVVYDMMGRELFRATLPNSTVNKVTIGDVSAYYIVKVITKEGRIYNDKVYITK